MHIRMDPSFFFTNKTGAPHENTLCNAHLPETVAGVEHEALLNLFEHLNKFGQAVQLHHSCLKIHILSSETQNQIL